MTKSNSNSASKTVLTRRKAISAIAATTVSLSGCSGGSSGSNPTSDGTPTSTNTEDKDGSVSTNVIGDISVEQDTVIVGIEDASAADTLQVLNPNGASAATKSISSGVSAVEVSIGTDSYTPGKYSFVAVQGEGGNSQEVDQDTFEIAPELEITRVDTSWDIDEEVLTDYQGDTDVGLERSIYVWVENAGTGPTQLTGLSFEGDVEEEQSNVKLKRWLDYQSSRFTLYADQQMMVSPDDSIFGSGGFNPSFHPSEGAASITVHTSVGQDITQVRKITYADSWRDGASIGPAVQTMKE